MRVTVNYNVQTVMMFYCYTTDVLMSLSSCCELQSAINKQ